MPRFFVRREQIAGEFIRILGEDAHHISRSLRMAVGENITVCDMQSFEYECELCEFTPEYVLAKILETRKSDTEPPYRAHLYQALPKGDKLDSIIQKAVECGVSEITTFESERCIVKVKGEAEDRKRERRQKIATEAAKQSGRGIIPTVNSTVQFARMLEEAAKADLALFCYEGDGTEALGDVLRERSTEIIELAEREGGPLEIAIVIGSEGGFSIDEAERARNSGMTLIGLGKRILRTETASGFVLACLVYEFELLGKNAKKLTQC